MQIRSALLAASILALPAAALAQPVTGPYVSLGVGPNIFQDQSIKSFDIPAYGVVSGAAGHITSEVNVGGGAALGWGFGNGFRVELFGDYLRSNVQHSSGLDQQAYGGFVDALYDFDLAPMGAPGLTPYLGLGVGYQKSDFNGGNDYSYFRNAHTGGDIALHAIVGIAFNIAAVPGLAVTAEYHFIATPENLGYTAGIDYDGTPATLNFKTDGLFSHTGLVGIRYALWQPAPPPPPPVAPPPPPPPPAVTEARTYLVFFDWDRADLTSRAKAIVAEAATASTHVQTTKIEVNGYTDLSGTAAYNQRLSVRRAESVEAELVRDGVNKDEISIHGYGESNPLVPTAKGVREPQNRRVEIILK
jgi:hypothetical protein